MENISIVVKKGKLVVKLRKSQALVVNSTLIGKKSSSMAPFLITFESFIMNVHNC